MACMTLQKTTLKQTVEPGLYDPSEDSPETVEPGLQHGARTDLVTPLTVDTVQGLTWSHPWQSTVSWTDLVTPLTINSVKD
ncbi:hypothetical protein ACOMHN_062244 [Nucella lapillus]